LKDGVYDDYIFLDICEKYGMNPITEFDPLPDDIKIMMKAKWLIDQEHNSEMAKKQSEG
jgi:hypothetical protein